ncbi:hypothetical protein, partial [Gluconacetobacter entanii]|uniref:hypothetical protein n=1 Tax=Gluconacetobacter entanii TaxID=108528 RepID=UPI0022360B28
GGVMCSLMVFVSVLISGRRGGTAGPAGVFTRNATQIWHATHPLSKRCAPMPTDAQAMQDG